MTDKWNVDELHTMLVQEETSLKNHENHSINYVNNQEAGKKVYKKHGKAKGPLKINGPGPLKINGPGPLKINGPILNSKTEK